jgi:hypothetical protein
MVPDLWNTVCNGEECRKTKTFIPIPDDNMINE